MLIYRLGLVVNIEQSVTRLTVHMLEAHIGKPPSLQHLLEKVTCWHKIVATLYFNILIQICKHTSPSTSVLTRFLFQRPVFLNLHYLLLLFVHKGTTFQADNHARLTGTCLWKEKSTLSSHILLGFFYFQCFCWSWWYCVVITLNILCILIKDEWCIQGSKKSSTTVL